MQRLVTVSKLLYNCFGDQIRAALGESVKKKKIAVWGAGVRGIIAREILEENGVKEFVFIDNAIEKQGKVYANHLVCSYKDVMNDDRFIFLSMEHHEAVKQQLLSKGLEEGKHFICLQESEVEWITSRLYRMIDNTSIIIGPQMLNITSLSNLGSETIGEMLESKLRDDSKVVGISNLNMSTISWTIKMGLMHSRACRKVAILVDLKTLNGYNHMLPRSQNITLLSHYKDNCDSGSKYHQELEKQIIAAKKWSENYDLENKYSPNRLSGSVKDIMKEYAERCLMTPFDESCVEWQMFEEVIEICLGRGIIPIVIATPLNMDLYDKQLGGDFREEYRKRSMMIRNLALKQGACYVDASTVFEMDDFESKEILDDILSFQGKRKFVQCILNTLEGED